VIRSYDDCQRRRPRCDTTGGIHENARGIGFRADHQKDLAAAAGEFLRKLRTYGWVVEATSGDFFGRRACLPRSSLRLIQSVEVRRRSVPAAPLDQMKWHLSIHGLMGIMRSRLSRNMACPAAPAMPDNGQATGNMRAPGGKAWLPFHRLDNGTRAWPCSPVAVGTKQRPALAVHRRLDLTSPSRRVEVPEPRPARRATVCGPGEGVEGVRFCGLAAGGNKSGGTPSTVMRGRWAPTRDMSQNPGALASGRQKRPRL